MKKRFKFLFILMFVVYSFTLAACDIEGLLGKLPFDIPFLEQKEEYNIYFYVEDEIYHEITIKEGESFELPSEPYIEGKEFIGWYYASGEEFSIDYVINGNVDLYAKFEGDEIDEFITLYFYVDGKYFRSETYEYGDNFTKYPIPTKEGMVFDYWALSDGTKFDYHNKVTESYNLYAVFKEVDNPVEMVIVNFYVDDKLEKTQEFIKDKFFENIFTPYKEGYTFSHWEDKNGKKYDYNTLLETDVDLYAVFDKIDYSTPENEKVTVNFYVDDKLEKTQEYIKDEFFYECFTPYKEGYTFSHWEDKYGIKYDINTLLKNNVNLYAVFEENNNSSTKDKIIINFYVDGIIEKSLEFEKGKYFESTFTPFKYGYTFLYWEDNFGKMYDANTLLVQNIDLHAVFKEKKYYYVNFIVDGFSTETQKVYEDECASYMPAPEWANFVFLGWYYNDVKWDFSTKITENIDLYAVYEKEYVGDTNDIINLNSGWQSFDPGIFTARKMYDEYYYITYDKPQYFMWSYLYTPINVDLNGCSKVKFELLMPENSKFILKFEGSNGIFEQNFIGTGKKENYYLTFGNSLTEEQLKSFEKLLIFIDYEKEISSGSFYIYNVEAIYGMDNSSDFIYEESSDSIIITGYKGNDTDIIIPKRINDIPVTQIMTNAFKDNTSIKSVLLPETISIIGDMAFMGCTSLESINIPYSVEYIGVGAFRICNSLKSIFIHDYIKFNNIPSSAFDDCTNLQNVTIGEGVETISSNAFSWCTNLDYIVLPKSLKKIDDSAFYNTNLNKIFYNGSIEDWNNIEISTNNDVLKNATLYIFSEYPPNTEGNYWNYTNGAPTIWSPMFNEGTNNVHNNLNKNWYSVDNGIYYVTKEDDYFKVNYNKPNNYQWSTLGTDIILDLNGYSYFEFDLCMPKGSNFILKVQGIEDSFEIDYYGSGIRETYSLAIPSYLTEEQFENFTNIYIFIDYDKTSSFGEYYIYNVKAIKDVTSDFEYNEYEDYIEITKYAGNDEDVEIPGEINGKPVTLIGAEAFIYNMTITSVEIPDTVTVIGFYSFAHCTSLISVKLPENLAIIFNNAFYNCISLESIDLPDKLEEIDNEAFALCTSLKYIVIPYSVKFVDVDVFGSCDSLRVYTEHTSEEWKNVQSNNSVIDLNITYIDGIISWMYDENGEIIEAYKVEFYVDDTLYDSTYIGYSKYFLSPSIPVKEGYEFIGWYYEPFDMFFTDSMTVINPLTLMAKFKELVDFTYNEYEDYIEITGYTGTEVEIVIPNFINSKPVKIIGEYSLDHSSFISVVIGDNVERIESGAFAVNGIETLYIGKSVNYIANDAFIDSTKLDSIIVDEENTIYDSRNSCNAIIETATNTLIKGIPFTKIPNSVVSIGYNAFAFIGYNYEGLANDSQIILPISIKSISENAFSNTRLNTVFYEGLEYEFDLISGINNLNNACINFDEQWHLSHGQPIYNISYENGYYYIEDEMAYFDGLNEMIDFVIPKSVNGYPVVKLNERSFYNHVNTTVYFEGTEEEWDSINRLDNPWRVYFYIDTKVNYPSQYGQYWYYVDGKPEILFKENTNYAYWIIPEIECTELALYKGTEENVIIPDYFEDVIVYSIYTGTFKDNENIKSIRINGQLRTKSIENCDNLEYLIISNMCVMFDQNSVVNCEKLTTIYYEDSQDRWNETFQYSNKSWLEGCEIYYYSETEPISEGDYWHYVDGNPVVWK